jgi:hypothetical protein
MSASKITPGSATAEFLEHPEMIPKLSDAPASKQVENVYEKIINNPEIKKKIMQNNLTYLEKIGQELQKKSIHHSYQDEDIWISPNYVKKIQNSINYLIPGSKNFLVKSFMSVKFSRDRIDLSVSSNRLVFGLEYKKLIGLFCNYLNNVQTLCMFYMNEASPRNHSPKLLISAKSYMIIFAGQVDPNRFSEVMISLDKLYQTTVLEHLPVLIMKFHLFKSEVFASLAEDHYAGYERAVKSVIKVVRGMGFLQEKKGEIKSPLDKIYSIIAAVNVDSLSGKNTYWNIFPIIVEITKINITIKIKLCKKKHVVKFEDEKSQKSIAEFITYANNDLKKAQFKLNYATCVLTLESNFVIIGLDSIEIQAGFQDLFSYMISTFKRYGEVLSDIHRITNPIENDDKVSIDDGKMDIDCKNNENKSKNIEVIYRENRNKERTQATDEYSQFLIDKSKKIPEFMIIPSIYTTKVYSYEEYKQEKHLCTLLMQNEIAYHIKFNDIKNEIKYPDYKGTPIRTHLKNASETSIQAIQSFISKLFKAELYLKNKYDDLKIKKEKSRYIVYISKIHSTRIYTNYPNKKLDEINMGFDLAQIILSSSKLKIEENIPNDNDEIIDLASFDEIDLEAGTGYLIEKNVELSLITKEEVLYYKSQAKLNYDNIDCYIGFVKSGQNFYIVKERLEPFDLNKFSITEIQSYFLCILSNSILLKSINVIYTIITENDLFINYKGTLKLRYNTYLPDHLWNCFRLNKSLEERQVYSLALLMFKLYTKQDPFEKLLEKFTEKEIVQDLEHNTRFPIFNQGFQIKYPKIVDFIKSCLNFEIKTLEAMKNKFPLL